MAKEIEGLTQAELASRALEHIESKGGCLAAIKRETLQVLRDSRIAAAALWHNRSAKIVILLVLIPWVISTVVHRDPHVWIPALEVVGIPIVYWFFTRGTPYSNLPVRHKWFEAVASVSFIAFWVIYRVAEYARLLVLPPITVACCGNLSDTIIPKMIEMFFVPLALFLALRYSLGNIGLGLPVRAWVPALLPLLALALWGLSHEKPVDALNRTITFYFAAGLAEEFLFRGLVMSRLEALTRSPAWGLFFSSFLFGVSHLPIDLYGSGWSHWQTALESAFTFQMGIGFALGFAVQRSRNLWPISLIHALIDAAPMM